MSVHDPESTVHEKAIALKMGRQKKIQIIDGQQVEVMPGEEDEDEDEDLDGSMMAVEGADGQQYVVLEVIHLQVDSAKIKIVYSFNVDFAVNCEQIRESCFKSQLF